MSTEEDAELKNLVAQTLENKGILPKIRAELRANVFLALEENSATRETLLKNDELSAFVKIPIGSLILNLIREFLEYFELEFTLSVFDPETKYGKDYTCLAKDIMMKELKITENKNNNPLLFEVIERVINSNESRLQDNEKHQDFSQIDMSGDVMAGQMLSPLVFNSTYVKDKLDESVPLSPLVRKDVIPEEDNEMIKEELTSNCVSDVDSLADLHLDYSPRVDNVEQNTPLNSNSKDSKVNSMKSVPNTVADIDDLLIFTPVKETNSKENIKINSLPSEKTNTSLKKDNEKSMSVLGDLPPLTVKSDESEDKINKIKAIIDKWPGLEKEDESLLESKTGDELNEDKSQQLLKTGSEISLKSDRSDKSEQLQKSDRSETSQKSNRTGSADDFEEDISDLLNGHTTTESQLTLDETISKVSCDADYLESI